MRKILVAVALMSLLGCSKTIVRDQDLLDHLTEKGYTEIDLGDRITCQGGVSGRLFTADLQDRPRVIGKICWTKSGYQKLFTVGILGKAPLPEKTND